MRLTERKIETLAADHGQKDRLVFDDAQRGLAVRVTASGSRTYLCQYTLNRQKWRVPLGSCSALSLSKAREAAAAVMGDVAKGRNPAAERKEAAAAEWAKRVRGRLTLAVLFQDWARLHLIHRRPRYATEAVRALRHALAKHLERPAEDLDRAAVVHALDSLSRRHKEKGKGKRKSSIRHGTAIAGRTAAYGRACFSWAMKRGTVPSNPFAELPMPSAVNKRDRVLSDEEAAAIWRAAGEAPLPYRAIVRLLMLTGQRREEVAGMTWAELSEDLATWTIPATRTKNGIPHLVPLSQPARELLHALPSDRPGDVQGAHQRAKLALVFPGERGTPFSGWSKAKSALDTASGVSGWWLHDLRRTLATGLQRLGVRLEVTEAVLNHLSGSRAGVIGIYQRHDWAEEKRSALDAWSAHLLAAAEGRLTARWRSISASRRANSLASSHDRM
jgi:integrase